MAWFGIMWLWMVELMAAGALVSGRQYDERVKWGTVTVPDDVSWGMDDDTRKAIEMMEGQA